MPNYANSYRKYKKPIDDRGIYLGDRDSVAQALGVDYWTAPRRNPISRHPIKLSDKGKEHTYASSGTDSSGIDLERQSSVKRALRGLHPDLPIRDPFMR